MVLMSRLLGRDSPVPVAFLHLSEAAAGHLPLGARAQTHALGARAGEEREDAVVMALKIGG